MSARFTRLLRPGVVMSPQLQKKIHQYEVNCRKAEQLKQQIEELRQQQKVTENDLADALAEDQLHRSINFKLSEPLSEEELYKIFQQYLGRTIEKLTAKYERHLFLESDMINQKRTIEKEIEQENKKYAEMQ